MRNAKESLQLYRLFCPIDVPLPCGAVCFIKKIKNTNMKEVEVIYGFNFHLVLFSDTIFLVYIYLLFLYFLINYVALCGDTMLMKKI